MATEAAELWRNRRRGGHWQYVESQKGATKKGEKSEEILQGGRGVFGGCDSILLVTFSPMQCDLIVEMKKKCYNHATQPFTLRHEISPPL